MDSEQIERLLRKHPRVNNCFCGVFASDTIPAPDKLSAPFSMVVNTDPEHKPGTHWVCFYAPDQNTLEYFDSFGMPPRVKQMVEFTGSFDNFKHNKTALQSEITTQCGAYCCVYLLARQKGYTMEDIVMRMKDGTKLERDAVIGGIISALGGYRLPLISLW